jgi:hypothetical protein
MKSLVQIEMPQIDHFKAATIDPEEIQNIVNELPADLFATEEEVAARDPETYQINYDKVTKELNAKWKAEREAEKIEKEAKPKTTKSTR